MAVLGPYVSVNMNGHSGIHNQLTKSLERILEDAYLSGELKLSGRKLKEFPKPVKFDLTDTVVADLSKNRFAELPDEVTSYLYLERLLLGQNAITAVPETVGGLQSLTFLDLSSNQLAELPREICQMPLQVLLLSNNLMTCLPKEIGRMTSLAELDASDNRLTHVPMTLGDCANMRALNLSNNQLGLLPLQITYLRLEHLNVSCNCISSLPLELRNMTSLVTLNLENNPLVSPPTTVCMRGRIHIFKYLETMANKESINAHKREDPRRSTKHNSYVSTTPQSNVPIVSGNATIDCLRHRPRPVVDSGYCTDGLDKRWCNDGEGTGGSSGRSTPSTPSTLSPGTALSRAHSVSSESPLGPLMAGLRISPDGNISNGDDKSKVAHQQTYRQYKEALRQQRQQDIYRSRPDQQSPEVDSPNHSPIHLHRSQSSPHSPVANGYNTSPTLYRNNSPNSSPNVPNSPLLHSTPRRFQNGNTNDTKIDDLPNKRPVQKVVPSRNVNNKNYSNYNGNDYQIQNSRVNGSPVHTDSYIKPTSPTKSPTGTLTHNSLGRVRSVNGGENGVKLVNSSVAYLKGSGSKPGAKIGWSKESSDKLSFTMKREFDKQKEELDLLQQLRTTIECRLKMSLPSDLAPVLCDGVVLCHLANHVRPRAVASVHVPSATQPKLTMARCRRNVDNFIEACRRIGVDEDDICSAEEILCHHPEYDGPRRGIEAMALTLAALLDHATPPYDNSNHPLNNIDPNFSTEFYQNPYKRNYTEDRVIPNFNFNSNQQDFFLEEDEYENNYQNNNMDLADNANYNPDLYVNNECLRNRSNGYHNNKIQFVTPYFKQDGVFQSDSFDIYDTDVVDAPQELDEMQPEQMERYDRSKMNLNIESNLNKQVRIVKTSGTFQPPVNVNEEDRFKITVLCLGSFLLSVLVLFLYPL